MDDAVFYIRQEREHFRRKWEREERMKVFETAIHTISIKTQCKNNSKTTNNDATLEDRRHGR